MKPNKELFNHICKLLKRQRCNHPNITFLTNRIIMKGDWYKLHISYSAYSDSISIFKTEVSFDDVKFDVSISKILNLINEYYGIFGDYDVNNYFKLMIKCELI